MIRAGAIDRFEGRSSLRSWLYRIANNVCIDMVRSPQRRARPMEMSPATPVAEAKAVDTRPEHAFVQPVADEKVIDVRGDRPAGAPASPSAWRSSPPCSGCRPASAPCSSCARCCGRRPRSPSCSTRASPRSTAPSSGPVHPGGRPGEQLDPTVDPRHEAPATSMRSSATTSPSWSACCATTSSCRCRRSTSGSSGPTTSRAGSGRGHRVQGRQAAAGRRERHRRLRELLQGPDRWPWAIQVIEVADGRIVGHHNFLGAEQFADFGLPAYLEAGLPQAAGDGRARRATAGPATVPGSSGTRGRDDPPGGHEPRRAAAGGCATAPPCRRGGRGATRCGTARARTGPATSGARGAS